MSATGPRIVSLLPGATEIVCALGLGDHLVGVSHECDFPGEVRGLPVLTAARLDPAATSAAIHGDVRALVGEGLSIYRIDVDLLARLEPDLVVTQDQCAVCAVSLDDLVAATREVAGLRSTTISLRPSRLDDVWEDVGRIADAAGVAARGTELAGRLRGRIAELAGRTERLERPRLACIEWLDPLMAAGNWVPELAAAAGADYRLAAAGEHSAWLAWEDLEAAAPAALCFSPCGFPLEQIRRELPALLAGPRWQRIPAVRSGRAYAVDGNAYLNRPGPRLVESAEILAGLLHPRECGGLVPPGAAERVACPGPPADAAAARTG